MTSTTSERSMMSQACGAISAHDGDYCGSTWRLRVLDGIRWQKREERLSTNRSNRPGDDMTNVLRTDNDAHAWYAWRTAHGQLWGLRQSAPPLGFPGEHVMITSMYGSGQRRRTVHNASVCCESARCLEGPEKEAKASR